MVGQVVPSSSDKIGQKGLDGGSLVLNVGSGLINVGIPKVSSDLDVSDDVVQEHEGLSSAMGPLLSDNVE